DKFTTFSDNKNESKQWTQLSTLFPNSEYPLDAIHCNRNFSSCELYKGDKRKLYSKDLSDKFVFKDETPLNSVGIPDNLDTKLTIPAPTTPIPTTPVTTESPDTTQFTSPSQTSPTPTKDYKNYIIIDPEEEKALRKEMIRSKLDALKAKQSKCLQKSSPDSMALLPNQTVLSFQDPYLFAIAYNATTDRIALHMNATQQMDSLKISKYFDLGKTHLGSLFATSMVDNVMEMSNSEWFGCPSSLCLSASIDAMIPRSEQFFYIFKGNYYWELNLNYKSMLEVKSAIQLIPDLRNIDTDDKIMLYSKDSNNKFVFKSESSLKSLGLPDGLDAVFTDENGDKIYIKNNYLIWKEYAIFRQKLIQKLLKCPQYFYQTLLHNELNSWQKFREDIKTYDVINFKEDPIPDPKHIPTTVTTVSTTTVSTLKPTSPPNLMIFYGLIGVFVIIVFNK
ncbi:unnamed protein product, partial [Medioppia subpectinata]